MVCELVELRDPLYMGSNYCLFFFENSDVAVNLRVAELIVLEVPQRGRNLVFAFMIEQDEEGAGVVIDLELGPHRFLYSTDQTTGKNDVVNGVTFEFTDVVRTGLGVHYHSYSDRGKNFGFPWFLVVSATETFAHARWWCSTLVHLLWVEKATWAKV